MRSFSLQLFIFICWLYGSTGFAQTGVHIEDLSLATQIPIQIIYSRTLPPETAKGYYFRYFKLSDTRGLLLPLQDQSYSQGPSGPNFAPSAREGVMPDDVAGSLYDKIDQLRRLALAGGPEVFRIAWIKDVPDDDFYTEVGLIVEHIDGVRLATDPRERSLEDQERYFRLLIEMSEVLGGEAGMLLPLDAHSANIVQAETRLRPVDVVLAMESELNLIRAANANLYQLRQHQAAYTLISGEESLKVHPRAASSEACRELLAHIRDRVQIPREIWEFVENHFHIYFQKGARSRLLE